MAMKKTLLLIASHATVLLVGFAIGIYALPILVAPPAPEAEAVAAQTAEARYQGQFRRNLKGSDPLHWGEGTVSVGPTRIGLKGKLAPGPDYKLYLSPEFVETKADFLRLKDRMVRVGDVKTFNNFLVPVPEAVNPSDHNTVIVWCETFSQFITAAQYR
jgi:hypothetical protein